MTLSIHTWIMIVIWCRVLKQGPSAEKLQKLQNCTACILLSASYSMIVIWIMCYAHWGGVNSVIESIASYCKMYNLPSPFLFQKFLDLPVHQYWLRNDLISADKSWHEGLNCWVRSWKKNWYVYIFLNIGPQAFYCRKQRACFHYVCLSQDWRTIYLGQINICQNAEAKIWNSVYLACCFPEPIQELVIWKSCYYNLQY